MKNMKKIPAAFLHLLALGIVGPVVISLLFGLLSAGLSTLIVFGVGLILLVALLYILFAVARLERSRISGLYKLQLPALKFAKPATKTFKAYLKSLWAQFNDRGMWHALVNFSIGSLIGVIAIVWVGASFIAGPITPEIFGWNADYAKPLAAAVSMVLGLLGGFVFAYFFSLISLAVVVGPAREKELRERAQESERQRTGAVKAAESERTRIERDLHDGVQPRLVSIAMTLGLASETVAEDPVGAKKLIDEAHASTKAAITELRQLARGIYPSVLEDRGLDAALSAIVARSHIPVQLDVEINGGCSKEAESAVYFAISEALTNTAKYSRASNCKVTVRGLSGTNIWAQVHDNGVGGADFIAGGGLEGMRNRIIAAGGSISLDSPIGGPTNLEVSVPCAS